MELELRALLKALIPGVPVNFGVNPAGSAYPAIVMNIISSVNGHHMGGPDALRTDRVQIDVYAKEYADLVRVRDDVRSGVDGYSSDGIDGAFLDSISQTMTDGTHRAMMTFFVNHHA